MKGLFEMKRLSLILLALIMCASLVLASCTSGTNASGADIGTDTEVTPDSENATDTETEATDDTVYTFEELAKRIERTDAKGELDNETLVTVNGMPISAAAVRYITHYITSANMLPDDANKEYTEFYLTTAAIASISDKMNAGLTEEAYTQNIQASIDYLKGMYGDGYEQAVKDASFTPYFYTYYTALQSLSSSIFSSMTATPDAEASKKVLETAIASINESGDYVRAKHVLIQFPEGEGENGAVTDEQKKAALDKANEVVAKANSMASPADFDALVAEYGEDPGMTANPGGYVFTYNEMVPEFEEATFALEDYAISSPVETTYGYHVIQKLPIEADGLDTTNLVQTEVYNIAANDYYYGLLLEESANYEIVYADNYQERISEFAIEYLDMVNASEDAANEEAAE